MASAALSTATNLLTQALSTTAKVSHLGELPGLVANVPFTFILAMHCMAVASVSRGRHAGQLMSYVNGFLLAFGGSVASNLFLGNPTANVLFQSNQAVLIWTAAWWVINHQPLDIVSVALDFPVVGIVARACVQVLRAGLIAAQVDATAKAFPGLVAPALIAGTLAGAGGKISTDVLSTFSGQRTVFELASPSYVLRSSVVGSVAYYLCVHVLRAMSSAEGLGLVLLAFLTHTLTDDLLGAAYDYTAPVIDSFTIITLIAAPSARASKSRGRPAAAAPTSQPTTPRSASKGRTPSRRTRRSD